MLHLLPYYNGESSLNIALNFPKLISCNPVTFTKLYLQQNKFKTLYFYFHGINAYKVDSIIIKFGTLAGSNAQLKNPAQ